MAMIYLLRHGQASFFKDDFDKLTELGIEQAKYAGRALNQRAFKVKIVASGSLNRHKETSHHCLKELGIKPAVQHSVNWNEYDHIELISKYNPEFKDLNNFRKYVRSHPVPLKALQDILNQSILDWIQNKHSYTVSWDEFKNRVWGELKLISSQLSGRENALVFTSGGPITSIVLKILNLKDLQLIDIQNRLINTSITKILVGKSGLSVSSYNDYGHLEHNHDFITYR